MTETLAGRMKTLIFLSLMLGLILSVALRIKPVVAGTIWWVDDDGGSGFHSIQQAVNAASDGDTIMVLSGTYSEHVLVDKSLLIIGDGNDTTIIDGGDSWTIITIAAHNITIKGFTLQHAGVGVLVQDRKEGTNVAENKISFTTAHAIYGDRCGSATITQNEISFNSADGIFLYASEPSMISDNLISSNGRYGMFIRYSSNNTVTGNLVQENDNGIFVYSDEDPLRASSLSKNNEIAQNNVVNNSCGIRIEHFGTDLAIAENRIHDNFIAYNNLGLNISGSSGNMILHNNFVDNAEHVSIHESLNNTWSQGYQFGGNHWTDPSMTDQYWGPNQNETGKDGIADVSYAISANLGDVDKYPFMQPNEWQAALTLEIVSPSNCTYKLRNVPLMFNLNRPAWLKYSLDNQSDIDILESVMLGDLRIGTHNVTVKAFDIRENEVSCESLFRVTFLGDLNVDFNVNIIDISMVARSYGAEQGSDRFDPNADLDNNLIINIIDMSIVAIDYGKQD